MAISPLGVAVVIMNEHSVEARIYNGSSTKTKSILNVRTPLQYWCFFSGWSLFNSEDIIQHFPARMFKKLSHIIMMYERL